MQNINLRRRGHIAPSLARGLFNKVLSQYFWAHLGEGRLMLLISIGYGLF